MKIGHYPKGFDIYIGGREFFVFFSSLSSLRKKTQKERNTAWKREYEG